MLLKRKATDHQHQCRILRALQAIIKANALIGESRLTTEPFFEGVGRPSGPFWGPQQGRRVILWESLSSEDQQKCLNELQDDTKWVIWCKAKPKDMATQAFREHGQCIFEGKREKPKQDNVICLSSAKLRSTDNVNPRAVRPRYRSLL